MTSNLLYLVGQYNPLTRYGVMCRSGKRFVMSLKSLKKTKLQSARGAGKREKVNFSEAEKSAGGRPPTRLASILGAPPFERCAIRLSVDNGAPELVASPAQSPAIGRRFRSPGGARPASSQCRQLRAVSEGNSPNRARYSAAKRGRCQKPHLPAMSRIWVLAGSGWRKSRRTPFRRSERR